MTGRTMSSGLAALILVIGISGTRAVGDWTQAPAYAFVDVNVIPMDRERVLDRHIVVVADGRITALGPSSRIKVPAGATIIDGSGKYLLPGMGDAHAHLSTVGGGSALAERALALYALNGVTMIRSMYTEPHHRGARERVERGEITGPRTVLASPAFTGQNATSPGVARDSLRKYAAAGYTIAKILPGLSRETFDTLAAEVRRLDLHLAGHVPTSVGLQAVLAEGYQSIEHLDGFLEAMIDSASGASAPASGFFGFGVLAAVAESRLPPLVQAVKRAGVTIVPTEFEMELFVSTDSGATHARRPEMRYAPAQLVALWTRQKDNFVRGAGVTPERAARYRDLRRRLIRELHAAGVPIALGSDAFNMFAVPGFSVIDELEIYRAAGLSNFAALTAATVEVAGLLGLPGVTGRIAVGDVADLVLLEANPLADLANVRRQAGVMLRGVWLPRAEIERRLLQIATTS